MEEGRKEKREKGEWLRVSRNSGRSKSGIIRCVVVGIIRLWETKKKCGNPGSGFPHFVFGIKKCPYRFILYPIFMPNP